MEKITAGRSVENQALSRASISDLLSDLAPHEFDVLWDLTEPGITVTQIAERNNLSVSQVNTIRYVLARKAQTFLK